MSYSQQRPPELSSLVAITEILTGQLPYLDKCRSVLTVLAEFTGSELVTLRELDPENSTLDLIAYHNDLIPPEKARLILSIDADMPERAIGIKVPVVVNDYPALKTRDPVLTESGAKSALILPVQVDGEIFGTLGFVSKSLDHYQEDGVQYQEDGVQVLVAIGAVVGMMIAKAELQEENEVEANIGRIVTSPLVGPDVFERFAAEAARIIDFERLALNSVNLQDSTFITEFFIGAELANYPVGLVQDFDRTTLGEVVRSRSSLRIDFGAPKGRKLKYRTAGPFIAAGQPHLLGVPLIVGGEVIGTIGFNRGSRPFSLKDVAKAERLASLVAGAFADFKLQEFRAQAEREISKNRAILEAEANIGRIMCSPLEITDVFERVATEIAKLVVFDRLVIIALDQEKKTFMDVFRYRPDAQSYTLTRGDAFSGTVIGEAVESGECVVMSVDDAELQTPRFEKMRPVIESGQTTFLAVPLISQDQIVGALGLSRSGENYAAEDQELAIRIGNLISEPLAGYILEQARSKAEANYRESEARFRQIADSIDGCFWLIELNPRRLVYASPRFENIWDIPVAAVYEDVAQWYKNFHPEDRPSFQLAAGQATDTGELDIEYRIIKQDGSVRWIRSRGFPVRDENGKVYRMSGIAEDVTERKLELERIAEAGRLLSIGELASGVAHEINNPLAAINLYSEALTGQDLPEPVIEDLKVISAQGKRAATIVRNLLQFARKSSPEVTTVHAEEFIERCVELKSYDFRINNISAATSVLLEHPEITIDEQLMTQVIINILSNAEQACVSANGRGHISVTVREVDGSTRISISDNGPGIPSQNLSKVFDPFFTTKDVGKGTGLGLSVSYGIIAQLGGKLWAASDGLKGATFHIEVPSPEATPFSKPPDSEFLPEDRTGSPLSVLVVDDETDLRNILVRLLERHHHIVDQAADGAEAWRKMQERDFDCILLDLRMAGVDGQKLYQQISSSDPGMAAKVIFITGDLWDTGTRSFLRPLSNAVLEKPISIGDLNRALAGLAAK